MATHIQDDMPKLIHHENANAAILPDSKPYENFAKKIEQKE